MAKHKKKGGSRVSSTGSNAASGPRPGNNRSSDQYSTSSSSKGLNLNAEHRSASSSPVLRSTTSESNIRSKSEPHRQAPADVSGSPGVSPGQESRRISTNESTSTSTSSSSPGTDLDTDAASLIESLTNVSGWIIGNKDIPIKDRHAAEMFFGLLSTIKESKVSDPVSSFREKTGLKKDTDDSQVAAVKSRLFDEPMGDMTTFNIRPIPASDNDHNVNSAQHKPGTSTGTGKSTLASTKNGTGSSSADKRFEYYDQIWSSGLNMVSMSRETFIGKQSQVFASLFQDEKPHATWGGKWESETAEVFDVLQAMIAYYDGRLYDDFTRTRLIYHELDDARNSAYRTIMEQPTDQLRLRYLMKNFAELRAQVDILENSLQVTEESRRELREQIRSNDRKHRHYRQRLTNIITELNRRLENKATYTNFLTSCLEGLNLIITGAPAEISSQQKDLQLLLSPDTVRDIVDADLDLPRSVVEQLLFITSTVFECNTKLSDYKTVALNILSIWLSVKGKLYGGSDSNSPTVTKNVAGELSSTGLAPDPDVEETLMKAAQSLGKVLASLLTESIRKTKEESKVCLSGFQQNSCLEGSGSDKQDDYLVSDLLSDSIYEKIKTAMSEHGSALLDEPHSNNIKEADSTAAQSKDTHAGSRVNADAFETSNKKEALVYIKNTLESHVRSVRRALNKDLDDALGETPWTDLMADIKAGKSRKDSLEKFFSATKEKEVAYKSALRMNQVVMEIVWTAFVKSEKSGLISIGEEIKSHINEINQRKDSDRVPMWRLLSKQIESEVSKTKKLIELHNQLRELKNEKALHLELMVTRGSQTENNTVIFDKAKLMQTVDTISTALKMNTDIMMVLDDSREGGGTTETVSSKIDQEVLESVGSLLKREQALVSSLKELESISKTFERTQITNDKTNGKTNGKLNGKSNEGSSGSTITASTKNSTKTKVGDGVTNGNTTSNTTSGTNSAIGFTESTSDGTFSRNPSDFNLDGYLVDKPLLLSMFIEARDLDHYAEVPNAELLKHILGVDRLEGMSGHKYMSLARDLGKVHECKEVRNGGSCPFYVTGISAAATVASGFQLFKDGVYREVKQFKEVRKTAGRKQK